MDDAMQSAELLATPIDHFPHSVRIGGIGLHEMHGTACGLDEL